MSILIFIKCILLCLTGRVEQFSSTSVHFVISEEVLKYISKQSQFPQVQYLIRFLR